MNIQLASDLHTEFLGLNGHGLTRWISPAPGADVLVLAGDIAHGANAVALTKDWPVPVILLAGNHEFYGREIHQTTELLRTESRIHGIHFLENESIVINGVRFLGTTMWTDYRLRLNRTQSQLMEYCGTRLNDHFRIQIKNNDSKTTLMPFTPRDALALHEVARDWLASELAKPHAGKTVVVTHHGCHPVSVHPRYIGDQLNAAFVSDLSDLMGGVDLWLHGHVHDSFDYVAPGTSCRVVANPAGYLKGASLKTEALNLENRSFNASLVIDI